MLKVLELSTQEPIASGAAKIVYKHPERDNALIKIAKHLKNQKQPSDRLNRLPRYWEYVTQIIEHLAVREEDPRHAHHLENIIGLVDTDLGVGMAVEAVTTPDGKLAPTVKELAKTGFSEEQEKAFDQLLNWVENTNTIIRDFSTNNVVWNEAKKTFVIIDGIGAKPFFSLRNFIRYYNIKTNQKKAEKLRNRLNGTSPN